MKLYNIYLCTLIGVILILCTSNVQAQPAPTITSFTPANGAGGTQITITGTNFVSATSLTIGGQPVHSFWVNSPTSIVAIVGAGATGVIEVRNANGIGASATNFTITGPGVFSNPISTTATLVLGQANFISATFGTATMWHPTSVAVDPMSGKIFVADANNNRVIRYSSYTALQNGALPEGVLGQPNLTSNTPNNAGLSASSLSFPAGVAVDGSGTLWVADLGNNRVLKYNGAANKANGSAADGVLGQPSFISGTSGCSATTLLAPNSLAVDGGGRLWVSDKFNHRILRYDGVANKANGAAADGVLGQPNFTTGHPNQSSNYGTAPTAMTLNEPSALIADGGGRLWVADFVNHRILRYDGAANKANGAAADGVLGQPNFIGYTSNNGGLSALSLYGPSGITVDGDGHLWVSDIGNYRILRYDGAANKANGAAADGVLGQPNFTSNISGLSATKLAGPHGLAMDGSGRLWVVDFDTHRVLLFNNVSTTFTITGTITGSVTSGVTVNLLQNGTVVTSATTGPEGDYSFTVTNGTYTITPSLTGFTFSPTSRIVTVNGENVTGQDFTATAVPSTYSITGVIRGAVSNGVSVSLTGNGTVVSGSGGGFSFSNIPNGTYTLTPSLTGFTFSPASRSVTVNGGNITGQDFTATAVPSTFSVSGVISGAVSNGVTLSLTGNGTVESGSGGNFSFTSIPNGTYTLTPSLIGFTFIPASRSVTVNGGNITGQDFIATAITTTFSVSGVISGAVSKGVVLSLTGIIGAVVSDSGGIFSFTNIPNGTYTLTPSLTGFTFSPASRSVTVNGGNITGQDFTATAVPSTYSITGVIRGAASKGVVLSLTGIIGAVVSDSGGIFSFTNIPNGTYTLTPSLSGFVFDPEYRIVTVSSVNVTNQDFTAIATFNVSGVVSGAVRSGVKVSISGNGISRESTTDVNGNYSFTVTNGTYTLTPSLEGYDFTPPSTIVTLNNSGKSDVNFTARHKEYVVKGQVRGVVQGGVTIELSANGSTQQALSDSEGRYSLPGVTNGTYSISAKLIGYSFTPTTQTIVVQNDSVSNVDFVSEYMLYNLTGSINGVPNGLLVQIAYSGLNTSGSLNSNNNSSYALSVTNGTYTITPSLSGFTFRPVNRTVTVANADRTIEEFSAIEQTISFSIEDTEGLLNTDVIQNIHIKVDGIETASLQANPLRDILRLEYAENILFQSEGKNDSIEYRSESGTYIRSVPVEIHTGDTTIAVSWYVAWGASSSATIRIANTTFGSIQVPEDKKNTGRISITNIPIVGGQPLLMEISAVLRKVSPNPTRERMRVSYEVLKAAEVRLSLYNAIGELVRVVLQEERVAGSYEQEVELKGLPSGVYFMVLEAGGKRTSTPIELIK